VTGTFFHEQTPASLADAVRGFDEAAFDPMAIRAHAERFDTNLFKKRMQSFIEEEMKS
jgi:hypothetical protein